jgi:hypothetical protein
MSKKKYVAPAITIVKCSPANSLLAASAPGMKWDPVVNKEYRMDIYEEEIKDNTSAKWLPDENTG